MAGTLEARATAPLGYARVELQSIEREDAATLAEWIEVRRQQLVLAKKERSLFETIMSRHAERFRGLLGLLETAEVYVTSALEVAKETGGRARAALLGGCAALAVRR